MELEPTYFAEAIKNYKPELRDFFVAGRCSFSNYTSVSQGEVGDCWLLGPLCALSKSPLLRPVLAGNFSISEEKQSYAVKLFSDSAKTVDISGTLFYIPKDEKAKADLLFAGQQQFLPEKATVPLESLWFCFIEKAVATFYGGYHLLDGGDPGTAAAKQADLGFRLLTGFPVKTIIIDATTDFKESIKALLTAGAAIVFTTKANSELAEATGLMKTEPLGEDKSGLNLLEDHVYVVDYISRDGTVKLYNPHGEFPKLKHNKAKDLSVSNAILYGKRLDIVILPSGGSRRRRSRRLRGINRRRRSAKGLFSF